MISFIYQYDRKSPKVVVRMPPDSTLDDVVLQFVGFLRCAGYEFEGTLNFVEEEENGEKER